MICSFCCIFLLNCVKRSETSNAYPPYNQRLCGTIPIAEMSAIKQQLHKTDHAQITDIHCLRDSDNLQLCNMRYSFDSVCYPCSPRSSWSGSYLRQFSFITQSYKICFSQNSLDFNQKDSTLSFLDFAKRKKITHLLPELIEMVYGKYLEGFLCKKTTHTTLLNLGFSPKEITEISHLPNHFLWLYRVDDVCVSRIERDCLENVQYSEFPDYFRKNVTIIATDNAYSKFFVHTGKFYWDSLRFKLSAKNGWEKINREKQ